MDVNTIKKRKGGVMTCVRFSEDEFASIKEDARSTGKSIPTLLKEKYFIGPRPLPLISKDDVDKLFSEFRRIGNNLNQIAKKVNSGIRYGFNDELRDLQRSYDQVWSFLSHKYCRCSAALRA